MWKFHDPTRATVNVVESKRDCPGGHVVLTVNGENAFAKFEAMRAAAGQDTLRDTYDTRGIVFTPEPFWQQFFPAWYGSTYHATWYVFAHWSRWFRIRAYVPRGALDAVDMILLERRDDDTDGYLRNGDRAAARRTEMALDELGALLARGTDLTSRSRYGLAGSAWRRALRILLRNYIVYQRHVDESVLRVLREQHKRLDR